MKQVSFILIYCRWAIGIAVGAITLMKVPGAPVLIVAMMTVGLIIDILDGIIAHLPGVAAEKLKVWDSK